MDSYQSSRLPPRPRTGRSRSPDYGRDGGQEWRNGRRSRSRSWDREREYGRGRDHRYNDYGGRDVPPPRNHSGDRYRYAAEPRETDRAGDAFSGRAAAPLPATGSSSYALADEASLDPYDDDRFRSAAPPPPPPPHTYSSSQTTPSSTYGNVPPPPPPSFLPSSILSTPLSSIPGLPPRPAAGMGFPPPPAPPSPSTGQAQRNPSTEYDRRTGGHNERKTGGMASERMRDDARGGAQRSRGGGGDVWERGKDVAELDYGYGYTPPPHPPSVHSDPYTNPRINALPTDYQYEQQYASADGTRSSERGQGGSGGRLGRCPSEESKDVIFLGLDGNFSEEQLLEYLRVQHQASVDTSTIIRDKFTNVSRGFGFANFSTLTGARAFIERAFPHLTIPMYQGGPTMSCKVDYAATGANGGVVGSGAQAYGTLDGDGGMRDIGPPTGSNRVLLIRGLDQATEQEDIRDRLSSEVERLVVSLRPGSTASPFDGRSVIDRIILIKDRATKTSAGFAFVETASTELASALLSHLLSKVAQPTGFIIHERPIACSFANVNAFTAVGPAGPSTPWSVSGTPDGGIANSEGWFRYRDESFGPSELIVRNVAADQFAADAFLAGLVVVPEAVPASMLVGKANSSGASTPTGLLKGQAMQPVKIGFGTFGKKTGISTATSSSSLMVPLPIPMDIAVSSSTGNTSVLGNEDEEDEFDPSLPSQRYPGRSRHAVPVVASRKIASNINKWNNKAGELKATLAAQAPVKPAEPPVGVSTSNGIAVANRASPTSQDTTSFDYTDSIKMACLLCTRQFKSLEILGRHCGESELHKKNLLDAAMCAAGKVRKEALATTTAPPDPASTASTSALPYRDRAAERRSAFNQPSAPTPEDPTVPRTGFKRKFAAFEAPPPIVRAEHVAPGEDESNKGNQLLKKMGWKEGTGLGTVGEGRVEPVQALLFAQGAGIGSTKGRDPTKYQGADGYTSMAKDLARDRYDRSDGQQ